MEAIEIFGMVLTFFGFLGLIAYAAWHARGNDDPEEK